MKLKKSVKSKEDNHLLEEMYHCCRWCHYYKSGKCYKENVEVVPDFNIYEVSENGRVDEALREVLNGSRDEFKELEYELRGWNISEKRIKAFGQLFEECFEKYLNRIVPELDENVARVYQSEYEVPQNFEGVEIKDPEEHYCKDWC